MKALSPLTNLEQAKEFYSRYYENGEKVRAEHVSKYSYRFTARFINIADKYKLFELLPLTSDKPADYCFLTVDKTRGVIIPDPFYEHKAKLMSLSPPATKASIPSAIFQQYENPPPVKNPGKKQKSSLFKGISPKKTPPAGQTLPKDTVSKDKEDKASAVDKWAI